MELGLELHTRCHQQSANALGAIELVAAEAEQINAHGQGLQALMTHQLGAIDMHRDPLRPAQGSDVGDWLQHADLVVGGHHADHHRVRP